MAQAEVVLLQKVLNAPGLSVSLVSNVNHSVYAAHALREIGILKDFYSPVVGSRELARSLPGLVRLTRLYNETRVYPEVEGLSMRPLYASSMMTEFARQLRLDKAVSDSAVARQIDLSVALRLTGRSNVLHFHSGYFKMLLSRAKRLGLYVICDHRSLHPIDEGISDQALGRRQLREFAASDLIVVNSELARSSLIKHGVNEARVRVLTLGVDNSTFSKRREVERSSRRVLFVGELSSRKGIETFAEAVAHLPSSYEIRVAGDGEEKYRRILQQSHRNLTLLGRVSRSRLVEEYNRASVLCLPSVGEAFGLVVAEAMACGLPVVVSDACGAAQLVEDGQDGFVVRTGSSRQLLEKTRLVAEDQSRMHAMSAAASVKVENFTWRRYEQGLQLLYQDLVAPSIRD